MTFARLCTRGTAVLLALALAGGATLAGCDTGSQRASQYQTLVGTWAITDLRTQSADLTGELRRTYDRVTIRFSGEDESGRYRLVGEAEGGTTPLDRDGIAAVPQPDVLVLGGLPDPDGTGADTGFADLRLSFDGTSFATLEGLLGGGRLLRVLLPSLRFPTNAPAELRLERVSE